MVEGHDQEAALLVTLRHRSPLLRIDHHTLRVLGGRRYTARHLTAPLRWMIWRVGCGRRLSMPVGGDLDRCVIYAKPGSATAMDMRFKQRSSGAACALHVAEASA
jgi:hypothetical protein